MISQAIFYLLPIQLILRLARFFLQQSIHPASLILTGRLRNPLDTHGDDFLAVLDMSSSPTFTVLLAFASRAVNPDASLIGHILRNGAALDQPRYFEKLIETHNYYSVFKLVACFESRNIGFRDCDWVTCLRVTACTARTFTSFESTETDQLNFISAMQELQLLHQGIH